jgi:hypothetical protein
VSVGYVTDNSSVKHNLMANMSYWSSLLKNRSILTLLSHCELTTKLGLHTDKNISYISTTYFLVFTDVKFHFTL